MRYFLSTGEPSGERSAILLARAIRTYDPHASFEGIGSARMRDEGFALWRDHKGWASMGPLAAIPRIPKLLVQMWLTALHIAQTKPDLVILVDFGVFNLRLAKTLRERLQYGGPILDVFPPGAWLDSERTARAVSKWTIPVTAFAHQEAFYKRFGLPIHYFGHPLLAQCRQREPHDVPAADAGNVALLPGSRSGELREHVPALLQAFKELQRTRPHLRGSAAASDTSTERVLRAAIGRAGLERELHVEQGVQAALRDADAAWVASGTAVLETVLTGVPVVAFYVVSPAVVWYGRRMQRRIVGGRFITLPNLILGEEVVPEYLQDEATPKQLAEAMDALLKDTARGCARFDALRAALGAPNALDRCAEFAVSLAQHAER